MPDLSERVRGLIREGAVRALSAPPQWLDELEVATVSTEVMREISGDPALVAAMRRSTRANLLHWATANVHAPGEPVAPNLGQEALQVARDLVRRGVHETALDTYRTGQNAAWLRWMQIVFELTSDPEELRVVLEVSARSINHFLDATIAGLSTRMRDEREALTRGTHAERREVVALVLDGAPITADLASHRLGYALEQPHRAAVIWSEQAKTELRTLEGAAEMLARAAGVDRALEVVASAATLWIWLPGGEALDLDLLRLGLRQQAHLRIALGAQGDGVEGFRRSHIEALTTQRMLAHLGADAQLATYDEVRLVALATKDLDAADAFVQQTLGALEAAAPELRATLLVYLEEGCHAARTARRLRAHRNTLSGRLARAEALLPRPLQDNRLAVGVALEILRWRKRGG